MAMSLRCLTPLGLLALALVCAPTALAGGECGRLHHCNLLTVRAHILPAPAHLLLLLPTSTCVSALKCMSAQLGCGSEHLGHTGPRQQHLDWSEAATATNPAPLFPQVAAL